MVFFVNVAVINAPLPVASGGSGSVSVGVDVHLYVRLMKGHV